MVIVRQSMEFLYKSPKIEIHSFWFDLQHAFLSAAEGQRPTYELLELIFLFLLLLFLRQINPSNQISNIKF